MKPRLVRGFFMRALLGLSLSGAGLHNAIHDAPATGASIELAPGIYNQSRTINIADKNNISISGATDNYQDTVIRGPGINDPSLDINVKLQHSDSVSLRNLTLKDSYYHGVQIKGGSDGFIADHVKTLDNGESGFKVASNPFSRRCCSSSWPGGTRSARVSIPPMV
jgi:hypothetical protein